MFDNLKKNKFKKKTIRKISKIMITKCNGNFAKLLKKNTLKILIIYNITLLKLQENYHTITTKYLFLSITLFVILKVPKDLLNVFTMRTEAYEHLV